MQPFELIYLGRSRFHQDRDATAMYFRVIRHGRYMGAYAGAVAGQDMTALQARPTKQFWAALAHASCQAIGVRLLSGIRTVPDHQVAETIWIKATDLKPHLQQSLPLPVEDEVFRSFMLEEDPIHAASETPRTRILSVGSTSISLKAAAAAPIDEA